MLNSTRAALTALVLLTPRFDVIRPEPEIAVFAGGCFWGVEAVFEHVKGVTDVVSGYSGGSLENPTYEQVVSGHTGHAEAVQVRFDPAIVSYETLLQVFFAVAHDPTQLDRQGPDIGPQYRSAVFFSNARQSSAARSYIEQLTREKTYPRPIVTQVVPLRRFYQAERYHQDYLRLHPDEPYIMMYDRPKLEHLRKAFPALYK
ncbi:MAG: peptide-methionine (S)-S-oxide reductase MsrA [Gemmatimonadota bacterium]